MLLNLEHKQAVNSGAAGASSGLGRQDILDRNGVLIAGNIPTASVYINPNQIRNKAVAINLLSKVLPDMDPKILGQALNSPKNFVWIKRHLVPIEQQAILMAGLPGVYMVPDERRIYPHNNLFSHVLGYTDSDGRGLAGVERYFDSILQDTREGRKPCWLSVDTRLQYLIRNIFREDVAKYNADGGVVALMDIRTREILSIVSLPDFDINNPGKGSDNSMFNRFSLGLYEMGSTFKSFTIASALDSGVVNMEDVFTVGSFLKINDRIIHDYRPRNADMNVEQIFVYSSNIGTAQIAMKMGCEIQSAYLHKLGFFEPLKIELLERAMPLVPKAVKWSDVVVATVSYGHSISVTPVHLMEGIATVVGDGQRCGATLIKQNDSDGASRCSGKKVFDLATVESMRYLFSKVVRHGTGVRAITTGYDIGGKTGSANKEIGRAHV